MIQPSKTKQEALQDLDIQIEIPSTFEVSKTKHYPVQVINILTSTRENLGIRQVLTLILHSFRDSQQLASKFLSEYFSQDSTYAETLFDTLLSELFRLPKEDLPLIFISRVIMNLTKVDKLEFGPVLSKGLN